jgi:hypothetical protein
MGICAWAATVHIGTFAHIEATAAHGRAPLVLLRRDPAVDLAVGAFGAAAAALWAPLPLAVIGLVLVGPAHTVLELRYVLGRFRDVLSGSLLWTALALVTVIAAARLAGAPARPVEIVVALALLAAGVVAGLRRGQDRRRRALLAAVGVVLAAAAAASLRSPAWFVLALLHLHNLVPAVFLWESSSSLRSPSARHGVRTVTVVALAVVPLAFVCGAFDALVAGAQPLGALGPGWATAAAAVAPPGWSGLPVVRLFAAFAYMQTVHYVVWCWVLPRHAPDAAAAFEQRPLAGRALSRPRLPLVVAAGTALVGALFLVDYSTGRVMYASLASYHAYLELPVLLAFLSRRS